MNLSDRPAFGRAVFRAGIQAENRAGDFLQSKFLPCGFNFFRRDGQLRRQRFRVRAERGGEVQIFVDLVRSVCHKSRRSRVLAIYSSVNSVSRWQSVVRISATDKFPHLSRPRRAAGRLGSGKSSATGARSRCAAEFRPARLQSPSAANWAAPAPGQIFRRAIFWRPQKTLSPDAKEIVSFTAGWCSHKLAQFFRREQRDVRVGKFFAQPQQSGRGHHGVAEPVRAAHQNSARMADGGWRMAVHVLFSILHFRF